MVIFQNKREMKMNFVQFEIITSQKVPKPHNFFCIRFKILCFEEDHKHLFVKLA